MRAKKGRKGAARQSRRRSKRAAHKTRQCRRFQISRLGRTYGLFLDPESETPVKSVKKLIAIFDSLFYPKGEQLPDARHLLFKQIRCLPGIIDSPKVQQFLKEKLPEFYVDAADGGLGSWESSSVVEESTEGTSSGSDSSKEDEESNHHDSDDENVVQDYVPVMRPNLATTSAICRGDEGEREDVNRSGYNGLNRSVQSTQNQPTKTKRKSHRPPEVKGSSMVLDNEGIYMNAVVKTPSTPVISPGTGVVGTELSASGRELKSKKKSKEEDYVPFMKPNLATTSAICRGDEGEREEVNRSGDNGLNRSVQSTQNQPTKTKRKSHRPPEVKGSSMVLDNEGIYMNAVVKTPSTPVISPGTGVVGTELSASGRELKLKRKSKEEDYVPVMKPNLATTSAICRGDEGEREDVNRSGDNGLNRSVQSTQNQPTKTKRKSHRPPEVKGSSMVLDNEGIYMNAVVKTPSTPVISHGTGVVGTELSASGRELKSKKKSKEEDYVPVMKPNLATTSAICRGDEGEREDVNRSGDNGLNRSVQSTQNQPTKTKRKSHRPPEVKGSSMVLDNEGIYMNAVVKTPSTPVISHGTGGVGTELSASGRELKLKRKFEPPTEHKPEPDNTKKLRVPVKRSIPESSGGTEPVRNSPKPDVRCILTSDQFPNGKQSVEIHAKTTPKHVSNEERGLGLSPKDSLFHNETRRDQERELTSDSSSTHSLDYDDSTFELYYTSPQQMTESVRGSQNTKRQSEDSSSNSVNTWLMTIPPYTSNLNDDVQSHLSEISIHGGLHTQSMDEGTFPTHSDGPVERAGGSSQMGDSHAQSLNPNTHPTCSSLSIHNRTQSIWDKPTYFGDENIHGIYMDDDKSFIKAITLVNKHYKVLTENPPGILKKPPLIETHIRETAAIVKTFDASCSTLTITQNALSTIKSYVCPQYWKGESCDKSCNKKHKMNCDEFPSVCPDDVFHVISARLIELKQPPLEMVSSLIGWLTKHDEYIKILSFSKIVRIQKGFNGCKAICGEFIKHLSTYFDWQPHLVVEYFLKFQYVMMKGNDNLTEMISRLVAYCQVGTYRHKVYSIVRFLVGVKGYSLPFDIVDKMLHEINNFPPEDIKPYKFKIKRQLESYEKCDEPNFRARAHMFLRKYFHESSSDSK